MGYNLFPGSDRPAIIGFLVDIRVVVISLWHCPKWADKTAGDTTDAQMTEGVTAIDKKSASECGKPFVSVFFRCCNQYQRICRHRNGDRYEGRCPGCLRSVVLPIGAKGTSQRIFEAQ